MVKELSKEEFERMHELQIEMLKEVDRVCRKHDIKYTIFGGTLLGAIRHKGFIPWDDDADIAMLREEYNKFKSVMHEINPEICYLQDNETDPEYRWGYTKMRKTGTRFVRVGQEHLKCKTGVFIDIFPMDDIPITTPGQIIHDIYCFCLRKILWSEVGKYDEKNFFKKNLFRVLSLIPSDFVFGLQKRMADKSRNDTKNLVRLHLFPATGTLYYKHSIKTRYGMPKEWFLDVVDYDFDGLKLLGSRKYHDVLVYIFNTGYMELPPEDQREGHAPVSDYDF